MAPRGPEYRHSGAPLQSFRPEASRFCTDRDAERFAASKELSSMRRGDGYRRRHIGGVAPLLLKRRLLPRGAMNAAATLRDGVRIDLDDCPAWMESGQRLASQSIAVRIPELRHHQPTIAWMRAKIACCKLADVGIALWRARA